MDGLTDANMRAASSPGIFVIQTKVEVESCPSSRQPIQIVWVVCAENGSIYCLYEKADQVVMAAYSHVAFTLAPGDVEWHHPVLLVWEIGLEDSVSTSTGLAY